MVPKFLQIYLIKLHLPAILKLNSIPVPDSGIMSHKIGDGGHYTVLPHPTQLATLPGMAKEKPAAKLAPKNSWSAGLGQPDL